MSQRSFREEPAKMAYGPAEMGVRKASRARIRDISAEEARKDGLRFAAPSFAANLCGGVDQPPARLSRAARAAFWDRWQRDFDAWISAGMQGDAPWPDTIDDGTAALDHAFARCMRRSGQRERWR